MAKSWCRRGCHLSEERTDLLTMIQMEAPPSGINTNQKYCKVYMQSIGYYITLRNREHILVEQSPNF
jgi:hypothetical protein